MRVFFFGGSNGNIRVIVVIGGDGVHIVVGGGGTYDGVGGGGTYGGTYDGVGGICGGTCPGGGT